MTFPEWVDERLSLEIPVLRARGEGQDLEYMVSFPEQVRELGKEIAAFATSNAGTILLGVNNLGDLNGLSGMDDLAERDRLLRRIEGICRGVVKPSITPSVRFASENGKTVLVITVPKGTQPVYYCQNIAYVRHITESRPAEPHEVIEFIQRWLPIRVEEDTMPEENRFLFELSDVLSDLIIYGQEIEERSINPWLNQLMATFGNASTIIRAMASRDIAIRIGIQNELEQLAQAADDVSSYRHVMGGESWERFIGLIRDVVTRAVKLKVERIDPLPRPKIVTETAKRTLGESVRYLRGLVSRSEQILQSGNIEQFQEEASEIGLRLLRLSLFGLDKIAPDQLRELQHAATELHLVETERIYLDGGASIDRIIQKVSDTTAQLQTLEQQLSNVQA